jgi:hypothetical protein
MGGLRHLSWYREPPNVKQFNPVFGSLLVPLATFGRPIDAADAICPRWGGEPALELVERPRSISRTRFRRES